MIDQKVKAVIAQSLKNLDVVAKEIHLEHPEDLSYGDFSTNAALSLAKELQMNPRELAEKIKNELEKDLPEEISRIEIAGPGFINFYLSPEFFRRSLKEILAQKDNFGRNKNLLGQQAIVEYTDPNPFKEFHIGHLMSNAIGEAISRLVEWSGAETKRACYQGDVGLHVAKTIWGLLNPPPGPLPYQGGGKSGKPSLDKGRVWEGFGVAELGQAYAAGAQAYEKDEQAKKEIEGVNKKIYERSDPEINQLYDEGRKISLEHFEEIYKKLGTKFDYYFFESESGKFGKEIVLEFLKKGIFEESENAIIFKGEKHDEKLHTRVFVNKEGLPTYEAKELGLAKIKYDKYPYDLSIVITGNEVNDYFRVLLKAMEVVFPELSKKTKHLSHGMLRLPTGKMSSRTGVVITGESLLGDISVMVRQKIESSDRQIEDKDRLINDVAVAALKYSILRQSPGKDIIFDFEKSISFEGDSGPYLQYSYARAKSVLEKSDLSSQPPLLIKERGQGGEVNNLEKLLYRFPEVVERSAREYAPNYLVTYLIELASAFNNFYARERILDAGEETPYRLALTEAFSIVLKNGLAILGIQAPEKM